MRFSIAAALLLSAVSPAWVQAQIKLPVFDESESNLKNVIFKDATDHADFTHGKLLRVTLNSGSNTPITGTLVRTDPIKRVIYVRTQPGAAPRAIAVSDIKRIEKGTIKRAADTGDVAAPEIWQTVIYNGGIRHVAYSAATLSSSELKTLNDLESAENDLSNQEHLARMEERVLANDLAFQTEQRKTRELLNQLLAQRVFYNIERPLLGEGQRPIDAGRGTGLALESLSDVVFGQTSPLAAGRVGMPAAFQKTPLGPESLVQTRRNYLAAQSHAVFENGRLIGVVVSEPIEKTSSSKP